MNELLPYEAELNQQWIDLPLPNENMAWADMRRRLDEEDERKVLPFWLTGCAGWALLSIVLLGAAWWIVRPEKWFTNKQGTEKTDTLLEKNKKNEGDTTYQYHQSDTATTLADIPGDTIQNNIDTNSVVVITTDPFVKEKAKNIAPENNNVLIESGKGNISKAKKTVGEKNKDNIIAKKKRSPGEKSKNDIIIKKKKENSTEKEPGNKAKPVLVEKETATSDYLDIVIRSPTVGNISKTTQPLTAVDSPKKKPFTDFYIPDTTADKKATAEKKPKKDSTKKNPMAYSAGIGLYQQLPVAGQQWVPYSSSGRKTSVADYIPSIYLRATKPGKWFLQSEFRYGAPQQTKEIAFRQISTTDTNLLGGGYFFYTNTYTLRKTFYHQLPLSFNYYVLPNWSVGAGMQWNNFFSAIAESEIIRRTSVTQTDSSLGKIINPLKRDSATEFSKTYWQTIVQMQYQWKRFSFGARYNFALQPYINFTLPGGVPQEEKNNSWQVYILFDLWKSKKK